eukprot:jgi/Mesvir1/16936/Mv15795-RA.1
MDTARRRLGGPPRAKFAADLLKAVVFLVIGAVGSTLWNRSHLELPRANLQAEQAAHIRYQGPIPRHLDHSRRSNLVIVDGRLHAGGDELLLPLPISPDRVSVDVADAPLSASQSSSSIIRQDISQDAGEFRQVSPERTPGSGEGTVLPSQQAVGDGAGGQQGVQVAAEEEDDDINVGDYVVEEKRINEGTYVEGNVPDSAVSTVDEADTVLQFMSTLKPPVGLKGDGGGEGDGLSGDSTEGASSISRLPSLTGAVLNNATNASTPVAPQVAGIKATPPGGGGSSSPGGGERESDDDEHNEDGTEADGEGDSDDGSDEGVDSEEGEGVEGEEGSDEEGAGKDISPKVAGTPFVGRAHTGLHWTPEVDLAALNKFTDDFVMTKQEYKAGAQVKVPKYIPAGLVRVDRRRGRHKPRPKPPPGQISIKFRPIGKLDAQMHRFLPATDVMLADGTKYRSCAVVGNGGGLLLKSYGEEINRHEAIFRFNGGPVEGFEAHVGNRTTYRLTNSEHFGFRTSAEEILLQHVTMEETLQAFRLYCRALELLGDTAHMNRYRGAMLLIDPHLQLFALREMNGGAPSNGFYGALVAGHLCATVTFYGFQKDWSSTQVRYHYYDNIEPNASQKTRDKLEATRFMEFVKDTNDRALERNLGVVFQFA